MSANLVNYDSSSNEEEVDDDDSVVVDKDKKEVDNYFFQQPTSNQMSSSSSDDDDDFRSRNRNRLTTTTDCSIGLPTALSALRQTPSSTIFTTEQSVEEAASQAILEQHVKLTEKSVPSSSSSTASSRAPICRAFKNGRCNRGDQCRFMHSLVRSAKSTDTIEPTPSTVVFSSSAVVYNDWEQEMKTTTKKRRQSGVTNTLLPTKKAMKIFERHRNKPD